MTDANIAARQLTGYLKLTRIFFKCPDALGESGTLLLKLRYELGEEMDGQMWALAICMARNFEELDRC